MYFVEREQNESIMGTSCPISLKLLDGFRFSSEMFLLNIVWYAYLWCELVSYNPYYACNPSWTS